jgi:tRNA 2-thiouridine synthesizing protein A
MATREQETEPTAKDRNLEIARHWDAGEAGCGVLIVGLKREIQRIRAGELLRVTAPGAGAAADVAAWCRLTGHTLVRADHPTYVLEKKSDSSTRDRNNKGENNG